MEVRLNLNSPSHYSLFKGCFNPCFNGSETKSKKLLEMQFPLQGFNPCFNGSETKSCLILISCVFSFNVSILVLMEVRLNQNVDQSLEQYKRSFNPCFNGSETKS